MSTPSPLNAPQHILDLLSRLHKISLDQEAAISKTGKVFSSSIINDLNNASSNTDLNNSTTKFDPKAHFNHLMSDKFIALDADKCLFTHSLIAVMGATNVIEAGTSFGVSTIYLALAVGQTSAATGKKGRVIATEFEPAKAKRAREYWAECGEGVEKWIELREGNILETLKVDLGEVDLLLLDSKFERFFLRLMIV